MIQWWQAVVLALVQGLTEFVPVSSSGHLAFAEKVLGLRLDDQILMAVMLHLGTLIAVLTYFRRDLKSLFVGLRRRGEEQRSSGRLLWLLAIGTVPAVLVGVFAEDKVEQAFSSLFALGGFWLLSAAFLSVADRLGGSKRVGQTSSLDALLVGVAQALAVLPGISRSGATLGAGLWRGFDEEWAPKFAFLLSIPVILGGAGKKALDLRHSPLPAPELLTYGVAMVLAAAVAYATIGWVFRWVRARRLKFFAAWCAGMGLVALVWGLLGG